MKFSTKFTLSIFLLANIFALVLLSCNESPKTNPDESKPVASSEMKTEGKIPNDDIHKGLVQMDPSLKGADRCKQCHEQEHKDWIDSHHDMAMKPATKENVVGDFNNAEFEYDGQTYKFYMKGDDYYALSQNGKGEMEEFKITYTLNSSTTTVHS